MIGTRTGSAPGTALAVPGGNSATSSRTVRPGERSWRSGTDAIRQVTSTTAAKASGQAASARTAGSAGSADSRSKKGRSRPTAVSDAREIATNRSNAITIQAQRGSSIDQGLDSPSTSGVQGRQRSCGVRGQIGERVIEDAAALAPSGAVSQPSIRASRSARVSRTPLIAGPPDRRGRGPRAPSAVPSGHSAAASEPCRGSRQRSGPPRSAGGRRSGGGRSLRGATA